MTVKPKPPAPQPAAPPVPPEVLAALEPHLKALVTTQVESDLAARLAVSSAPGTGGAPRVLQYKGLALESERPAHAALGLHIKRAFLDWEDKTGREGARTKNKDLRDFLDKVKSAGVFEGVFGEGGSVFARESRSEDLITVLRNASILLSMGCRVESDYGSKLTIGAINGGVKVAWEGEDEKSTESDLKTGDLVLGAYKAMGTLRISNDLLRKGSLRSAEQLGDDVAAAMGLAFDEAGLFGKGPKRPTGIINMPGITKKAISGTEIKHIVADTKDMIADVIKANISLQGANPFYFMTATTLMYLSSLRDSSASGTGGWVFPGLQDLQNPKLNGYPVGYTESLAGKDVMGFALAQELYFGNASPLEIEVGENGDDFNRDRKTLRGVQEGDWQARRPKAFSIRTGVNY